MGEAVSGADPCRRRVLRGWHSVFRNRLFSRVGCDRFPGLEPSDAAVASYGVFWQRLACLTAAAEAQFHFRGSPPGHPFTCMPCAKSLLLPFASKLSPRLVGASLLLLWDGFQRELWDDEECTVYTACEESCPSIMGGPLLWSLLLNSGPNPSTCLSWGTTPPR